MPKPQAYRPNQQESTAQQLRSFNEVARLESFTAAATVLELSVPTVWHQVKKLEQEFGESLLSRDGRGVCLTDAGRQLAELSQPLVTGISDIKSRFNEFWRQRVIRIDVAATPRIFLEDLPPCVARFRYDHPDIFLAIGERLPAQIAPFISTRQADLGFIVACGEHALEGRSKLIYEPVYPLEVRLVMSKGHPLAGKKGLGLAALAGQPIFSSLNPSEVPGASELLTEAGLKQGPIFAKVYSPRRYDATFFKKTAWDWFWPRQVDRRTPSWSRRR